MKTKKPKEDTFEKLMKENIKLKERLEKYKPKAKPKEVPQLYVPPKPILCVCGKEVMWDINIRDKCAECNHKHFLEEFKKAGLNEDGYSVEKKKFYSHTTGIESYDLKFISGVNVTGIMGNSTFPSVVYTCDTFGCHENTLGITKGFGDYLIKELGLIKVTEGNVYDRNTYKNPLIKEDTLGKKRAEIEKEIEKKKKEIEALEMKKYGRFQKFR